MAVAGTRVHHGRPSILRWVGRGLLVCAAASTLWLANSFRTQGVPDGLLRSSVGVSALDGPNIMEFLPRNPQGKPGLIFICGAGVSAHAYASLLRPIAEAGYPVFVAKLPYRFAPLASHKQEVVARVRRLPAAYPETSHWVVSGHSLGGALAARAVQADASPVDGLVLIGTTYPKSEDLSKLGIPVTKVYATSDGIAPVDKVMANKKLLPEHTEWVKIEGGNHSQFGHYGHQLFDGKASISRHAQQAATRAALLRALQNAENTRAR